MIGRFLTRNALAAIRVRCILAMGRKHHCETHAEPANDNGGGLAA